MKFGVVNKNNSCEQICSQQLTSLHHALSHDAIITVKTTKNNGNLIGGVEKSLNLFYLLIIVYVPPVPTFYRKEYFAQFVDFIFQFESKLSYKNVHFRKHFHRRKLDLKKMSQKVIPFLRKGKIVKNLKQQVNEKVFELQSSSIA